MPVSISITKAEQLDRSVATLVSSGVTFSSYQTPEWFMFMPKITGSFNNVVGVTVSGLDGVLSHTIKIYVSKTNNYESIVSNNLPIYLLHSTTITNNGSVDYTVSITSGNLPPSDKYYVFAIIDEGTSDETLSSYYNVTISHNDFYYYNGAGQLYGSGDNIVNSQLISETVIGFKPKLLILDISYNVTRDMANTSTLEEFTGDTSSNKCYLSYNPYTDVWKCLSICKYNISSTENNFTYFDDNKIYIIKPDGTVVAFTVDYIDGFGFTISNDTPSVVINKSMFQCIAYGGLSLKSEIVQSVANATSVAFSFDPSLVMIDGGLGLVDGGNAKKTGSTGNYIDTFGALDRSDTSSQTFCYASYGGVCKSYTDALTSKIIAAGPDAADRYTIRFDSFATKQINLTYTGSAGYNSYIIYYINMNHPTNGTFQNVSTRISGTPSSATQVFHKNLLGTLTYNNYTKTDNTDTYHSAYTLSSYGVNYKYRVYRRNNYLTLESDSIISGRIIENGALSVSKQFNQISIDNYLYSRSDTFLVTSGGENSVDSRCATSISGTSLIINVGTGGGTTGTFTNLYTFSTIGCTADNSTYYSSTFAYSNTAFNVNVADNPRNLLHHNNSFTIRGEFNTPYSYRLFLSETIDMSNNNIVDITSLISASNATTITVNALSGIGATQVFYNKSTAYLITLSNNLKINEVAIPIIVTTTNANDYRTHVKSFNAVNGNTLIFNESQEGFKFSSAILTLAKSASMPYENINQTSTVYGLVYISYNYHSKQLKCAYISKYQSDSVSRVVACDDYSLRNYTETSSGLVFASNSSPFYETNKVNFSYIPGQGLYIESYASPGVAANIMVFGGPSCLSDMHYQDSSYTTSLATFSTFLPTIQFNFNTAVDSGQTSDNIIAASDDISVGAMTFAATKEYGFLANKKATTAGGTKTITGGGTYVGKQITATAYTVSYSSTVNDITFPYVNVTYSTSSSAAGDNLYMLSLFTGSTFPSIKTSSAALPTSGGSSTRTIAHATTAGSQAVMCMYFEQTTTASPVATTDYTAGCFGLGFASMTKAGLVQAAFETNKSYLNPTAGYHTRIHNSKYTKSLGTYISNAVDTFSRASTISNLKQGAGPYGVDHSITSAAGASNTIYGTFVEIAFPIGSGVLVANSTLDYRFNFQEGMLFASQNTVYPITPITLDYTFQSGLEMFYGLYHDSPLTLSYTLNTSTLSHQLNVPITPITLDYTINNLDLVRSLDVGTPLELSYTFQSYSLTSVIEIPITPVTLTYGFGSSSITGSLNIPITVLSIPYSFETNNFAHQLSIVATTATISYSFESNALSYSNDLAISPVTLNYNFGSSSILNTNIINQADDLELSYVLNNSTIEHNLYLTASVLNIIMQFENPVFNYSNVITEAAPLVFDYSIVTNTFNYSYTLNQPDPFYYSYTVQSNNFSHSLELAISELALNYTLNNINIVTGGSYAIDPITLSYTLNNLSIVGSIDKPITPITMSYVFEANQFNYNNTFAVGGIVLSYSFGSGSIDYINSLPIIPITMNYDFGSMSFGDTIVINQATPLELSYTLVSNNIDYTSSIAISPVILTYGYQTYYLTNSIILNQPDPIAVYLIVNGGTFSYSNQLAIGEINQSFNIQNNNIAYTNSYAIPELALSYTLNNITKLESISIGLSELALSYTLNNNLIVNGGNLEFPINEISLTYTLNNINIQLGNPIELLSGDPLRNYIIFESGMLMNVPSYTYINQDTPLNIGYFNYGEFTLTTPYPTNLVHNVPIVNNYSFGNSYITIAHNIAIDNPVTLTYAYQSGMYMEVDESISISPLTLSYNYGTYTLESTTNIFQNEPLAMSYAFGTFNIVNTKSIAITPITLILDFNDSAMFFEYSNQLKYDNLVSTYTTTILTVKYLK